MVVAIILAGGVGSRFGSDKPKQYFLINKKPVLYHTVNSFVKSGLCDKYVIVMSQPFFKLGQKMINDNFENPDDFRICDGGITRQHSLLNGVNCAINEFGGDGVEIKILSHCAARPIVPTEIIKENIDKIKKGRVANTVRNVYDTMLYTNENGKTGFIDRKKTFVGLTPQSFYASDYVDAFNKVIDKISTYTCACSLMTDAGYEMDLIKTDEQIHKITLRSDVNIIKQQLKQI